ncbi:MAG: polysaccharide pyruvyl transferase family protein [Candidatus Aenigmatarchaeota archaeon]
MDVVVLGYYSSINKSNLCMLKGLPYFMFVKKVYLPVLYPHLEKSILAKENVKEIYPFNLLNLFKLFQVLFKSEKILFLFGDSLTGVYGIFSRIFVFFHFLLILFLGKKSVVLPSTILPSKFGISLLKFFLKKVSKIYVREKEVLEKVRKINKETSHSNDLSILYLKRVAKRLFHEKKQNVVALITSNISPKFMGLDRKNFVVTISKELAIFLENNPNYKIALIPIQFGVRTMNDDRLILNEIYNMISEKHRKKIILIKKLLTLNEILRLIRRSKVLISTRLHPCIFAHVLNTRFIALSENLKIISFAKNNKGLVVRKNELNKLSNYLGLVL